MEKHTSNTYKASSATRSVWTRPTITIIRLNEATGAVAGPLCDKHGSLSRGTNC